MSDVDELSDFESLFCVNFLQIKFLCYIGANQKAGSSYITSGKNYSVKMAETFRTDSSDIPKHKFPWINVKGSFHRYIRTYIRTFLLDRLNYHFPNFQPILPNNFFHWFCRKFLMEPIIRSNWLGTDFPERNFLCIGTLLLLELLLPLQASESE